MDEKDPEKSEVPPRHSSSSPRPPAAPDGNSSTEDDIERQKTSEQQAVSGKQNEEQDPNLIEWDGPDDPVSCRFTMWLNLNADCAGRKIP